MKRITVDLEDDLYESLRGAAFSEHRTMAAIVRELLVAYTEASKVELELEIKQHLQRALEARRTERARQVPSATSPREKRDVSEG